ncbi:MAG: UTP--glucose-1-phosphate uridylyltransferase, partial [Verrucomicrobia bacterium]
AGPDQRTLPLQTLIDRDGQPKTALRILIEELVSARIEEVGVVVHAGDTATYRQAAEPHTGRVTFIEQDQPRGYGHAIRLGREFVGGEPFLLMVSDHLYLSRHPELSCAAQLVQAAAREDCAVSAVQATHESQLPAYGAVGGDPLPGKPGLFTVETVLEKPTPTAAEQALMVPGLRAGYYLCFFGMHVLTPTVMELLDAGADRPARHLSEALADLARKERYLACELQGRRFDIGARYGLLTAQLALALNGRDRDEVLTTLLELLIREPRS